MKLALDTNAYSAYLSGNTSVVELVRDAEELGLPIIVLGELRFGFLLGSRLTENEAQLAGFFESVRVEVLHVTETTARLYGEIATQLRHNGTPIQQNDIWIAALCKEYGYTLATRDRDYHNVLGLPVIDFPAA